MLVSVPVSVVAAQPKANPKVADSSAIQVEMVKVGEVEVPAEFQVALYEHLVEEIEKDGAFSRVYRDGDRTAADAQNLIVMHAKITGFKEGSEMARQVTTVSGKTSIAVDCQLTDKNGSLLLEHNINGQVRFFGDNLRATYDFAKKASKAADEALSAYQARPKSGS